MVEYPYRRTEDGRDYRCSNCGTVLPEGVFILGHYTDSGNLTGVRAEDSDGNVRHECGTKVKGLGQHKGGKNG